VAELLGAAEDYWSVGWKELVPLPRGGKAPIPAGLTGYDGEAASWAELREYIENGFWAGRGRDRRHYDTGGLALRMPRDAFGIDIDYYKPAGKASIARLGTPAPTWRSTARADGISGVWFYRCEPGKHWPGVLAGGIEIIQRVHRYAAVWPTVHHTGRRYEWYTPDGELWLGELPGPDSLPEWKGGVK
jgi:hypothetical protein